MTQWKIPLYKILTDHEDVKAVEKVIRRGMDWAIGPEVEEFEVALSKYVDSSYCLTFNSGTSALHAALLAIETKLGNEVIVPSFTFIATSNSVLMVNAKPKFTDIEEETYGIDPDSLDSVFSRKTHAIIPIHYGGLPCRIEEITKLAKQKKVWLIEDAAESLGAKIGKKMTGTFGDLSVFSFAGNKVLTTGEGGAITTNSKQLFEKLKLIRSHGRLEKISYFSSNMKPNYVRLGYNWRMSSITAALGITQLKKLDSLIKLRRRHAQRLSRGLKEVSGVKIPSEPAGSYHTYQFYSIETSSQIRNKLMRFLETKGIMSKVFFHPIHLTKFYKDNKIGNRNLLRTTEKISDRILSLPLYPSMKNSEIDYICDSVSEFFEIHKFTEK